MISVIICTYNRKASLHRTLSSLAGMEVPESLPWELLIVDNNSTDGTREVVTEFSEKLHGRYIFEGKQGKSHALNRGLKEAKGDIIALTDDDVIVDKNWIKNIYKVFQEDDISCIGGKILPHWEKSRPAWLHGDFLLDILALVDLGSESKKLTKPIIWGANMAMKYSMFEKYGYFDTTLGHHKGKTYGSEDTKMVQTLLSGGETVLYCPDVLVYHCIPENRLKKSHFRKWVYEKGELAAIQLGPYTKRNILGIPLYIFKEVLVDGIKYLGKQIASPAKAFNAQLALLQKIGFLLGRARFGHRFKSR